MGSGQGGLDKTPPTSEKQDPRLNEWTIKIRNVRTEDGADAFAQYKQGIISKAKLCELIAAHLDRRET